MPLFAITRGVAERQGFEPWVELLTPHSLSKRAPSASRSSLPYKEPPNIRFSLFNFQGLAEEEGFEPPVPLQVRRFSKPLPSATRPLLQRMEFTLQGTGAMHSASPKPCKEGKKLRACSKSCCAPRLRRYGSSRNPHVLSCTLRYSGPPAPCIRGCSRRFLNTLLVGEKSYPRADP